MGNGEILLEAPITYYLLPITYYLFPASCKSASCKSASCLLFVKPGGIQIIDPRHRTRRRQHLFAVAAV